MPARVLTAEISYAKGLFDIEFTVNANGSALATLKLDDGSTETFSWYHDELSYRIEDFVGKTMDEIRAMHYERDVAYLRS